MAKTKPRIMTKTDSYVTVYPQFIELANTQFKKCYWNADEISVEKDKQDMLVNMTEAEVHAVTTALKLFVKYEMFAGNEYWLNRVMKRFPRPEVQRMASTFGMFELAVHAPFYNKLNEALGLNTDAFYTSYVEDEVLKERMDFLDTIVDDKDGLLSLAVFSIVEGAILFSSFALFKNFQSNGNNKIPHTVSGINQSVIDEGLHQIGGATLFNTAIAEIKEMKNYDPERLSNLHVRVQEAAKTIYEHESRISDMFFEKGDIKGISANTLKEFVKSRINICLADLGIEPVFQVEDNPIVDWFYSGVQKYQMNDFFARSGREYTRDWSEEKFVWKVTGDN